MKRFFEGCRAQWRAIALAVAAFTVLGGIAAFRMPSSILPEVTFPRIAVIADCGELPSAALLREVTIPLETAVRRVPGVAEVRSITSRGSAELNLDCRWGTDMNLTLQRVQAQLEAARPTLPDGTALDARLMNPTLFPFLGFSLTSSRVTQAELRDFADFVIKPELSRIPGVAEVVIQGGVKLEARVTLDPAGLRSHGLDAAAVAEAVRSSNVLGAVGLLESNQELYLGLVDGRPADLAALRELPIPVSPQATVPLGEISRIELEPAPQFVRYRAQGQEAVLISLLRQPAASAITLARDARRWFEDNRRRLPPGSRLETFYDQSTLVRASVGSVRDSLLVGALLAIAIIILALRSLRLGLAGAAILPVAIGMTLVGLWLAGQSLNLMTLGGIAAAIGLVLDDAIVVVEQIAHRAATSEHPDPSAAMVEIVPALLGSSACTIAIFVPLAYLDGVTGAFFRVLALAMSLMLISSLLLCLTMVPLLARGRAPGGAGHARAPAPGPESRPVRAWGGLEAAGRRIVRFATGRVWVGLAATAACVAVAVVLLGTVESGFLPEMDEGSLILDYLSPPGTSLAETDRMLQEVEREIARTPEVAAWSRRTGNQLGFFITEPNNGDYVLRLRERPRRSAEAISDDLRDRIGASQPALTIEFGQLVEDVIGDLTTSPQPIEMRVFCEDRALVEEKAREVAALLERVPDVVDVKDGIVVSGPSVTAVPSPLARRFGLSAGDLERALEPAVGGLAMGEVVRGARGWPLRIVLPPPQGVGGGDALAAVAVPVKGGGTTRLDQVATLRTTPGETEVARDNLRTMVSVTARLSGRDQGSAIAEIQRRVKAEVRLPREVQIEYGGQWAEQRSSFLGLAAVLAGAAALVILLLTLSFRSFGQVGAVMLVVLASLAGVFAALRLTGVGFNISSFLGTIMLVGIVSENAFFVVDAYRARRTAGEAPAEAAAGAAARRARPVLMTTLAGIAALAPLAVGLGPGSAMLKPLAIAVIGGFAASSILLLVVLPSLLAGLGAGRKEALEP